MVVKKVGKNQYVLQEASAKQIAAWDKAGKRLGIPQAGGEGPQHVHGFLIGKGGLNKKLMADAGFDRNHRIGNRTLFAGTGGMTAERATELLAEAGYLKAGASHSDMFALVRKSVQTPQYTSDGREQLPRRNSQHGLRTTWPWSKKPRQRPTTLMRCSREATTPTRPKKSPWCPKACARNTPP